MWPSRLEVAGRNETNPLCGYDLSNGDAYFNYKGCKKPVTLIHFEQGMENHTLTQIKVSDVYIGNTSLKTKLGL